MRALILFASLVVSTIVAAEEFRYLIPVSGYIATDDGTYYYATTILQNLSPLPATVATTGVYPLSSGKPCATGEPFTIAAQGRETVGPIACMANASAIEIVSDQKLLVRTELEIHKTLVAGWDKEILDAPTDWIPAGVTAVSEAIIRTDGPRKANLLVINPAFMPITMTVEMTRPELARSSTMTIEIPARSLQFIDLPEITNPAPPPFISSVDGRHLLRLTATGMWQGGVSSVFKGPSMYVPATALEP
jgi:hypothetical protein